MKRFLILVVFCLFMSNLVHLNPVYGQEKPHFITVKTDGSSRIVAGDVEQSRLTAIRIAYAKASHTFKNRKSCNWQEIECVSTLSDIIASRSKGFVKNYQILGEGISERDNAFYEVLMEALVLEEGHISQDEKEALKLYLNLLNNPRLLILIAERGMSESSADENGINSLRGAETALAEKFNFFGYEVITSDDLLAQGLCNKETLAQAKAGVSASALQVARAVQTDLALVGNVTIEAQTMEVQHVKLITVTAALSAKALIVSSGKFIDAFHHNIHVSHPFKLKAYSDCIEKMSDEISLHLAWKIPQILSQEYRETGLIVEKISSTETMTLKNVLKKLSGVEQVRLTQLPTDTDGRAQFLVITGFITPDPTEVITLCETSLHKKLFLTGLDKYTITCKIKQ